MFMRAVSKLVVMTGPSMALQEILYGFIMALIFVNATAIGFLHYDNPTDFVLMVTGMVVTWGTIDAIVFYYLGICDQKRYIRIIGNADKIDDEARVEYLMDELSGTPLDVLNPNEQKIICKTVLDQEIESEEEMRNDRKVMAMSSLGCLIWSVMTLIPILLPVFLMSNFNHALFVSQILATICLFGVGFYMAKYIGTNRYYTGFTIAGMSLIIALVSTFTGG